MVFRCEHMPHLTVDFWDCDSVTVFRDQEFPLWRFYPVLFAMLANLEFIISASLLLTADRASVLSWSSWTIQWWWSSSPLAAAAAAEAAAVSSSSCFYVSFGDLGSPSNSMTSFSWRCCHHHWCWPRVFVLDHWLHWHCQCWCVAVWCLTAWSTLSDRAWKCLCQSLLGSSLDLVSPSLWEVCWAAFDFRRNRPVQACHAHRKLTFSVKEGTAPEHEQRNPVQKQLPSGDRTCSFISHINSRGAYSPAATSGSQNYLDTQAYTVLPGTHLLLGRESARVDKVPCQGAQRQSMI